jgi:integral membrane protein
MLKLFRIASLVEGLSYLLILCVTLGFISREFVGVIGMGHGVLFMAYCALSLSASHKQNWSVVVWLLVLAAAVVPFAFIPVEMFLKKECLKHETSA